jgi:murein DD-endopeptidase MepM/ murein hydrolase activator NlpD
MRHIQLVLVAIIIGTFSWAQTNQTYQVQPGDTLFKIAQQFGTSVNELVRLNDLPNAGVIEVGQTLIIRGTPVSSAPSSASSGWPAPFTEVLTSANPSATQGRTFTIQVGLSQPAEVTAEFLEGTFPLSPVADGARGLIGIGPLQEPGSFPIKLAAKLANGETKTVEFPIRVEAGGYNSEAINLPASSSNLLDRKLIDAEWDRLIKIWSDFEPNKLWDGVFGYPVTPARFSSIYGTRRSFNGGPYTSFHEGLDFRGAVGTPVHAAADGKVVLAEKLTVRGNAVIIDHGMGAYSGYWHMSELGVKPGEVVKKGQQIGKIGATGMVTGPHLHWEIRILGVPVNPQQWVSEVFLP